MQLFESQRHVAGMHEGWDPARVSAWLRGFAADALAVAAERPWPAHPRDVEDAPEATGPFYSMYLGAFGVWLALVRLADAGDCRLPRPWVEIFEQLLKDYVRSPDTGERVASWSLGESALLTACCLLAPDSSHCDELAASIRGNRDNPTREALWGAPGTMLAALFMHEATGAERWAALFRDGVAALWGSWEYAADVGCWLWRQDMYGQQTRYVGAGHGWAGNLYPLWRGFALLSASQQGALRERTLQGLAALADVDGDLANWPPEAGKAGKLLVQWCHGAPGIITSLRHVDDPAVLPLIIKGGRLIVAAGPIIKGVALCHGTAGNGMALLEVYRRTGDAQWLAWAREFAMVAIRQSEADASRYGQRRYSLWTGDAGLAWFLGDCLEGRSSGLPGLDRLWLATGVGRGQR